MVTREEVKNAMEYQWRGSQVKTYLGLWAGILLFTLVVMVFTIAVGDAKWDAQGLGILGTVMAVMIGVYSLVILPFALYCAYKQWEMAKNCGRYQKYRVKLDEPNTSWMYRGAVEYRVVFQPESGGKIARYTRPLFSSAFFSRFPLSDYNNKTVEIFYDPELDTVILAGNAQS